MKFMQPTAWIAPWSLSMILALASVVTADQPRADQHEPDQHQMVPFVIPPTPDPDSLVAFAPGHPIAVDSPHVVVANAHFSVDGKPIKFWAVNLTFATNFPEHAAAEGLALRLSQAGVNCVRLHHMDMHNFEDDEHGIWDRANPRKLSAEAMDRLDYLLDQLGKRGIYADINLHVSRTHSKFIGLPPVPGVSFDKMTDLFMPPIIEAEKDYARQLLGHVNKYRGVRFADDPIFAILEISNEDSFFDWGAYKKVANFPEPYAGKLRDLFCDWLGHRYGSTAALRKAWGVGAGPMGDELLRDNQFADVNTNWYLEMHQGGAATITPADGALRINVSASDAVAWHVEFEQQKIHVVSGQHYTLKFSARADGPRRVGLAVSQGHEPWSTLGLDGWVEAGTDWKNFTRGFVATDSDDQARLAFEIGDAVGTVDLKDVSLRPGGREGLAADESLEKKNIALFGGGQTSRRLLDASIFLIDTQKAFYDGMNRFIKDELHCNIPATGSIVFSPLDLYCQSGMDFIDGHAYWQHPQFPSSKWDEHNWVIKNIAMVDHPQQATLFNLAATRLAGKPFTNTEYTHPAPNDYQAETVPEIAAFAAQQDWDAVFLFDCGAVPSKDHFEGFFDLGPNPSKWAFMSSGATIFRGRAIASLARSMTVSLAGKGDPLDSLARYEMKHNLNMFATAAEASKLDWPDFLKAKLYLTIKSAEAKSGEAKSTEVKSSEVKSGAAKLSGAKSDETGISWKVDADQHGVFAARGPGAFVWVGRSRAADDPPALPPVLPPVSLKAPTFAAMTIVAIDGKPLSTSKRVLITACGRCENTDMPFNPDRSTVGANFGKAPVLIEPVDATIRLPGALAQGRWHIQPLGPSARPIGPARELKLNADGAIEIAASDATVWHLLTRD